MDVKADTRCNKILKDDDDDDDDVIIIIIECVHTLQHMQGNRGTIGQKTLV